MMPYQISSTLQNEQSLFGGAAIENDHARSRPTAEWKRRHISSDHGLFQSTSWTWFDYNGSVQSRTAMKTLEMLLCSLGRHQQEDSIMSCSGIRLRMIDWMVGVFDIQQWGYALLEPKHLATISIT